MNYSSDLISMFGLNEEQFIIKASIERLLIEKDIQSGNKTTAKQMWLKEWEEPYLKYISTVTKNENIVFLDENGIVEAITNLQSSGMNMTWYYLLMFEMTHFWPYSPIGANSKNDSVYMKLKFSDQTNTIKDLVGRNNIMDVELIDQYMKAYTNSISKLNETTKKNLIAIACILAAVTLTAIGFLTLLEVIILIGIGFVVKYFYSYYNRLLTIIGGSYVPHGATGNPGDPLAIIGGGAMLGLLNEGPEVDVTFAHIASSNQTTLTQSAKLETVIKEILINTQKDNYYSQVILQKFRAQLDSLTNDIANSTIDFDKYKAAIRVLQKSLKYMESVYTSSMNHVSNHDKDRNNLQF